MKTRILICCLAIALNSAGCKILNGDGTGAGGDVLPDSGGGGGGGSTCTAPQVLIDAIGNPNAGFQMNNAEPFPTWLANSFQLGTNATLTSASVRAQGEGTLCTSLKVEIRSDADDGFGGHRPSTTVLAQGSIPCSSMVAWTPQVYSVTFDAPVTIVANTSYWVIMQFTDPSAQIGISGYYNSPGSYAGGNFAWSGNPHFNAWNAQAGDDLAFALGGCP